MGKHNSSNNKNNTSLNKLWVVSSGVIVFCLMFLAAFLSSRSFMPIGESSATEFSVQNAATGYYANIATSGTVNLSIASSPDGTLGVGKDSLTIDTNATSGYRLYIGMVENDEETTGIADEDSNRLYLTDEDGTVQSSSGYYLSPSTGALRSPVALGANTWGYVPGRTNNSESATDYSTATKADAVFAGVPTYGNETAFYTNTSPSDSSANSVDVYYGVNASTALPSGTYKGTIAYTAVVDISGEPGASIAPVAQSGLAAGQTVTISTGLYPGFSVENIGDVTVTIGTNTCTSPTPIIDSSTGSLKITCTVPAQASAGAYDVVATIAKYDKVYTITGGYTYIAQPYTVAISNTNTTTTVDGAAASEVKVEYGGSATVTVTPATGYALSSVTCPSGYTCTGYSTGDAYTSAQTVTVTNNSTQAGGTITFVGYKVPTEVAAPTTYMQDFACSSLNEHEYTTLKDRRDNKDYRVAKLKDGNCWMTSDLKFTLTEGDVLKPATTNVSVETAVTNNDATGNPATTQATRDTTTAWCMNDRADCDDQYKSISYDVPNGYLYNWYAATAGTGTYSTGVNVTVSSSICPKGWTLPVDGTTSGTYYYLLQQYGWDGFGGSSEVHKTYIKDTLSASPLYFNNTGVRVSGSTNFTSTSTVGYYWSRTASPSHYAYSLSYSTSTGGLNPRNNSSKNRGFAVRCISTQ